jgi:chaperonin GroES
MENRLERPGVEAGRHQLRPLFDRIVIKELDSDRMRRSGLVVPPGTHDPPPQQGIVLAVGPGLDWWEHVGVSMPVQPGDHVVFPATAGVWVEVDEERLLVCGVGDLLGVLESVPAPTRD